MTSRGRDGALDQVRRALGRRLRDLRVATGLTQEAASQRLGVSSQALRSWEAGRYEPTARHLEGLARLYRTTLTDLLSYPLGVSTLSELPSHPLPIVGYLLAGAEEHEASQPLGITHLPTFLLREYADAFALIVVGQSLEVEGLKNGDLVLVDPVSHVSEDGIYIVQVGQSPFPRYLAVRHGGIASGSLAELAEQPVRVLGRIVWHLRRV